MSAEEGLTSEFFRFRLQNFNVVSPSDFGRPGQPVVLAPIYVLLASQEASFITGEVYGATGGKGIA